jgi:uncharacterized protein (TIGR03437 family)
MGSAHSEVEMVVTGTRQGTKKTEMLKAGVVLLLAAAGLVAQPTAFVSAGSSYGFVAPLKVAPGQITTVLYQFINVPPYPFQRNSAGQFEPIRASQVPWPTSLAGFSVGFRQGVPSYAGPVFQVAPAPSSADSTLPGNILAAVTFQVPFEIQPGGPPVTYGAYQGNQEGGDMDVILLGDQIHIATTCDNLISSDDNYTNPINHTGLPWGPSLGVSSPCLGLVTHADGSLVTQAKPAQPGEEVVLYAVGLGQTNPPQQTGQPAASAAPTVTPIALDFNYRPNSLATKPAPAAPQALFAGATPGFVGLYQVNFVVPPVPTGTPACQAYDVSSMPLNANLVYSNLTVSVGGAFSFDGAGICVAVPAPE